MGLLCIQDEKQRNVPPGFQLLSKNCLPQGGSGVKEEHGLLTPQQEQVCLPVLFQVLV